MSSAIVSANADSGKGGTWDETQKQLVKYACELRFESLSKDATHAAKVRIIDTLGALIGGFHGESCEIARKLAAQTPYANGASIIGTSDKTTIDMAAFVNATTARYVEMNDTNHWPGSYPGHPSDVVTPILGVAEHVHATGRELITAVVLGYEVFLRISDEFGNKSIEAGNRSIDATTFCCIASAVAAGKLLNLSPAQMSHCIAISVVPNVILRQVRTGHLTMFKAAASGYAAKAGIFAAQLALAGMEGPSQPFSGKGGWSAHVAKKNFSLRSLGQYPLKVQDSLIKPRASCGTTISSILSAEKIAPLKDLKNVKKLLVEVYKKGKEGHGTGEHHWNPVSREMADHSIPYAVAVTLMDGTVTPRQFDDDHIWNPDLRALLPKIEVIEDTAFTKAYAESQMHFTRVTVEMNDGKVLVGETGGQGNDLSTPPSDEEVTNKFHGLTETYYSRNQADGILNKLWKLEEVPDSADIPKAMAVRK